MPTPMKLAALTLLLFINSSYAKETLDICIDYHCELKQDIQINDDEWQTILKPFNQPAVSAKMERQQIRESIGLFEIIIGNHTPTHKDLAENKGEDETGQLDCIAESRNSQHYLQWLAKKEKLKWHTVNQRVKRSPHFFDVHWGVKITDTQNQAQYIVDSWYGANGDMPDIQPLSQWLNKQ